jgi:hypothetical protein
MPVMSKTEQIIAVVNAMLIQLPEKVTRLSRTLAKKVSGSRDSSLYLLGEGPFTRAAATSEENI